MIPLTFTPVSGTASPRCALFSAFLSAWTVFPFSQFNTSNFCLSPTINQSDLLSQDTEIIVLSCSWDWSLSFQWSLDSDSINFSRWAICWFAMGINNLRVSFNIGRKKNSKLKSNPPTRANSWHGGRRRWVPYLSSIIFLCKSVCTPKKCHPLITSAFFQPPRLRTAKSFVVPLFFLVL